MTRFQEINRPRVDKIEHLVRMISRSAVANKALDEFDRMMDGLLLELGLMEPEPPEEEPDLTEIVVDNTNPVGRPEHPVAVSRWVHWLNEEMFRAVTAAVIARLNDEERAP